MKVIPVMYLMKVIPVTYNTIKSLENRNTKRLTQNSQNRLSFAMSEGENHSNLIIYDL
jgi:hypothetical protein